MEQIIRKLSFERIDELKKAIQADRKKYKYCLISHIKFLIYFLSELLYIFYLFYYLQTHICWSIRFLLKIISFTFLMENMLVS